MAVPAKPVSSVENGLNKKASSDAFFVSAFSTRGHGGLQFEVNITFIN